MRARASVALFVAAALLTTVRASAQDTRSEARAAFERGVERFDAQRHAEAVLEFERAYQLHRHFAVLYNLGLAYLALDRPADAANTFDSYLEQGGVRVSAERRAQITQELMALERRLGVLVLREPVGATVTIDGLALEDAIPTRVHLLPGSHDVVTALEGHSEARQRIELAAGQRVDLVVAVSPVIFPPPTAPPPTSPSARAETARAAGPRAHVASALSTSAPAAAPGERAHDAGDGARRPRLAYWVGSVGVAFLAASAATYAANHERWRRWRDEDAQIEVEVDRFAAGAPDAASRWRELQQRQTENNELWRKVEAGDQVTLALLGVGVVGVGSGLVLFLREPSRAGRSQRDAAVVLRAEGAPTGCALFVDAAW